jgi:hypothetical protein
MKIYKEVFPNHFEILNDLLFKLEQYNYCVIDPDGYLNMNTYYFGSIIEL